MTYGFALRDANEKVIANDTDFNWGLWSEGSVSITTPGLLTTNSVAFQTGYPYANEKPLVFYRAPASRRKIVVKMDRFVSTVSKWAVRFYAVDSDTSVGDPVPVVIEYKIFVPMKYSPPTDGSVYGLIIRDAAELVTFDSRVPVPVISQVLNVTFPVWDGSEQSNPNGKYFSLSTNYWGGAVTGTPWICSTDVLDSTYYRGIYSNTTIGDRRGFDTSYYCNNNAVTAGYVLEDYSNQLTLAMYSSPLYRNQASGSTAAVMLMSGSSTALTGWINYVSGTTSGTTTTTQSFYAEFVGGTAAQQTYTWQLINSTSAGFTLSSTDRQATVGLTAADGTYTVTLRCTITQAGSTPLVLNYNISRTHASFALVSNFGMTDNSIVAADEGIWEDASSTQTATLTFSRNGTWGALGNSVSLSGNWGSPTTTTAGDNYWIKFTRTAGNGTATTAWLPLNTDQSVNVVASSATRPSTLLRTSTYTIQISSSSSGSPVLQDAVGIQIRTFLEG